MKTEALARGLAKLRHGFRKHSPEIYTGAGIIFSVGALALGIIGTIKAQRKVEEIKEEEQIDKLPTKEIIKATWPLFVPSLAVEIVAIVCMVGSNSASRKAIGALSTAYSLSETAFRDYKQKVIESIGAKKEEAITEKVTDDIITKHPPTQENIIDTCHGDVLFFEVVSGQYFTSSVEFIKKTINELNRRMRFNDYISLNEFYSELDIEQAQCGDLLGWNINKGYIDVHFSAKMTKDGRPCGVLEYLVPPIYHYMDIV